MKYIYPCVMKFEEVGYSVIFPDLSEATSGETLDEALYMAQDLLNCTIEDAIEEGEQLPKPTPPEKVVVPEGAFMTLILVDTEQKC